MGQSPAQFLDGHIADAAVRRARPSKEPRHSQVGWVIQSLPFGGSGTRPWGEVGGPQSEPGGRIAIGEERGGSQA